MSEIGLPLFGEPDPVPYQGRTATTRAASASGARRALEGRATKLDRLRAIYRTPHTMQDAAQALGVPLSSVCSLTARLQALGEIEAVGTVIHVWPDARTTTRTQWRRRG